MGEEFMNIDKKLKEVIVKVADIKMDSCVIEKNTNLIDDLFFDSILLVNLISEIEEEFKIKLEDKYLDVELLTVYDSLYKMITSLVN